MSNKIITQYQKKRAFGYAAIFVITTFALLSISILPTDGIFAVAPNNPEKTGCNPQTDTDCFPDEVMVFDNPSNTRLLVLGSQTTSSNTPTDSSVDIEADELVVKGCKGGTAGEVPGKPGVCKE
jgi:hypothetical protein